jgi:ribose 5-phosphate isomerase B
MSSIIAVASDHRGVQLKRVVFDYLKSKGHQVRDLGPQSEDSVDYPDFAFKAAEEVARGKANGAVVICHSGIGVSISANKVKGIRAALCHSAEQAALAKKHTNANVLAIPAGFVKPKDAEDIVTQWMDAQFEGGRHDKRIRKITNYERQN